LVNNRVSLLIAAAVLVCVYCFLLGESGILQRFRFLEEKRLIEERITFLEERQRTLRLAYEEYREGRYRHGDAVMAGFIGSGEKIVFLRNLPGRDRDDAPGGAASRRLGVELKHLRILWGLVSVTVLALIILKKKEKQHPDDTGLF